MSSATLKFPRSSVILERFGRVSLKSSFPAPILQATSPHIFSRLRRFPRCFLQTPSANKPRVQTPRDTLRGRFVGQVHARGPTLRFLLFAPVRRVFLDHVPFTFTTVNKSPAASPTRRHISPVPRFWGIPPPARWQKTGFWFTANKSIMWAPRVRWYHLSATTLVVYLQYKSPVPSARRRCASSSGN